MATPKPPRKVFYLIALLLPVLLLLVLEMLLRVSPWYQRYPLFIASESLPGYLQTNPDLIKRYFADPKQAPDLAIDTQYFPAVKPAGQFRIVLQGGSSAAGFPYGRFGSPAAMLQQRLKRLYPQRDILVLNTALSAVNSYTLRDLSAEILAIEPDLILIYAGHNEYLGLMGVGSALLGDGHHLSKLLYLQLRQLALFQAGQRLYSALRTTPAPALAERTMMAQIAAEQQIPLNSSLYQAGLQQFQANLKALLHRYQQAGVPVVLSSIASNERQPPFSSSQPALTQAPEPQQARQQLQQALQQHPDVASWHFQLAELLLDAGEQRLALQHFQLAREHDLLRFRAPLAINQQLQQLASDFRLPLADAEAQLRQASNNGIIDYQLMLEHLHPNARGYFLIAETWLPLLERYLGPPAVAVSLAQAWADMPLTAVDLQLADYKIRQLTADYPFTTEPQQVSFGPRQNPEQQLAWQRAQGLSWLQSSQQLLDYYQQQQQPAKAAKVAALLFDALPNQHQAAYVAGQLYFDSQDLVLAMYYQQRAVNLAPENISYRLMLARSYYYAGELTAALQQVEHILTLDPTHALALRQQAQLRQQLAPTQAPGRP